MIKSHLKLGKHWESYGVAIPILWWLLVEWPALGPGKGSRYLFNFVLREASNELQILYKHSWLISWQDAKFLHDRVLCAISN